MVIPIFFHNFAIGLKYKRMKRKIKKIYTILVLIINLLIRRRTYILNFLNEEDFKGRKRWYYVFKHWGFAHDNLEMVAGADKLCEFYSNGRDSLRLKIKCSKKPLSLNKDEYDEFISVDLPRTATFIDQYILGRDYVCRDFNGTKEKKEMWICPVTLFVLGRYPKYIYVKKK